MSTNKSTKNILKEIDIIKDRDYVLSELKKSELEKSYWFEESYKLNMTRLSNLSKKYANL